MNLVRCRWCGEPCPPRDGLPGYRNACPECHELWLASGGREPERLMAGLSEFEDGTGFEIAPAPIVRRTRAYHIH